MRSTILRATVLGLTLASTDAWGYCRTTTVHPDSGYNPAVSGCWTQGVPLAWPAGHPVAYSLASDASRQVGLADATAVAHVAFAAWNEASCTGGNPNLQVFDTGPVDGALAATDCGLNPCDPTIHDNLHLIVFRDDSWPHNDPVSTLALTTVTYGVDTGTIFDADIEINSTNQHTLSTVLPPPPGTVALQAILTHEAGHFFGLAHATDINSIMYAYYQPDAIHLTADDIAGVCTTYPPLKPDGGGCALAKGSAGPLGVLALAGMAGGAFLRRSRRRSR